MIELLAVNKSYGDVPALVDINADVTRGEVVVVCGPSGSGKSTLIRTINRLEEIQSGDIRFDGMSVHGKVKGAELNRLRSRIGFVFQNFNLFPHLSVLDNITLSPMKIRGVSRDAAKAKAMQLLDRVGLADRSASYPAQLSGGQQQRVAIAARSPWSRPPCSSTSRPARSTPRWSERCSPSCAASRRTA